MTSDLDLTYLPLISAIFILSDVWLSLVTFALRFISSISLM